MSAQDDIEKVLRSLHVMLSKSEPITGAPGKVAVDKQEMIDLLTSLNKGVYAIMDEYELTTQSRDRAERQFQKHGEEIIRNANRKAEDIYAASVMYTDEALNHVQEIMRLSSNAMQTICNELERKIEEEERRVKTNQMELKSQLQDLVDTDKYLKLIEDRNREIEKEKAHREGRPSSEEASLYANRKTEVRVNTEVLEKLGLSEEKNPEAGEMQDDEDFTEIEVNEDDEAAAKPEERETGAHKVWKNLPFGKR